MIAVRVRATFDETWWEEECGRCGEEVREMTERERYNMPGFFSGQMICPTCGIIPAADVSPSEEPHEAGGWCSVSNPYGDRGADTRGGGCGPGSIWADDRDAYTETLTLIEAAELVAEFPGDVWNGAEGDGHQDLATGHYIRITLHLVDHQKTVFELAETIERSTGWHAW